jgi:hypothetical protein
MIKGSVDFNNQYIMLKLLSRCFKQSGNIYKLKTDDIFWIENWKFSVQIDYLSNFFKELIFCIFKPFMQF